MPTKLKSCHCCGLIQQAPEISPNQVLLCVRCGSKLAEVVNRIESASRTAAAAMGAFFLFWPAILLPILRIEQLGFTHQSSILGGTLELFSHGSYFVGGVVMLFSIIFPLTKIVLLIELSFLEVFHRKHKAFTLRMMEHFGKWSERHGKRYTITGPGLFVSFGLGPPLKRLMRGAALAKIHLRQLSLRLASSLYLSYICRQVFRSQPIPQKHRHVE